MRTIGRGAFDRHLVKVILKQWYERPTVLEFLLTDSIEDIKFKIQEGEKVTYRESWEHISHQWQLKKNKRISDYSLEKDSVLRLFWHDQP